MRKASRWQSSVSDWQGDLDDGSIKRLQKEAKKWYAKPFNKPSSVSLSLTKYGLWDRGDNLHDALEHDAPHFKVV